jgi:hypothetical protein
MKNSAFSNGTHREKGLRDATKDIGAGYVTLIVLQRTLGN